MQCLQVWGWLGKDSRCRAPGVHLAGLKYRKGKPHLSEREDLGSERGGFGHGCALMRKYFLVSVGLVQAV